MTWAWHCLSISYTVVILFFVIINILLVMYEDLLSKLASRDNPEDHDESATSQSQAPPCGSSAHSEPSRYSFGK